MELSTESSQNFQTPPINFREPFTQDPVPYQDSTLPSQVTRANFADFITKSFATSHGMLNAQMIYFAWVANHTGQDVKILLNNFVHAGMHSLTNSELENIKAPFKKVPTHQETVMRVATSQAQYDDIFNYQLWKYLKFCAEYGFDGALAEQGISQEDLAHMSKADLANKVKEMKNHSSELRKYPEGDDWQMEYINLHRQPSGKYTRD